ncbi:hypothetical protein ABH935_005405 [Catenulispora sp. GAS73]|uniref:hypothetical protein n=1 Tax=Catenulispora sp. GAS73 TaxID=3156269 RepID=UPI003511F334
MDRTARLLITSAPGESTTAVLTGHPVGQSKNTLWTISITNPTPDQIIAAASAAARIRLAAILAMVDNLRLNSWNLDNDAPAGTLCLLKSPGEKRSITRLNGTDNQPGGWLVNGDGLNVEATDGTPESVLEALALTAAPARARTPETPLDTTAPPPPTPGVP